VSSAGLTGASQQYKDALQYWEARKIRLEQGHRPQALHNRQGADREETFQKHGGRLIPKPGQVDDQIPGRNI
jgi:hypothetical protein